MNTFAIVFAVIGIVIFAILVIFLVRFFISSGHSSDFTDISEAEFDKEFDRHEIEKLGVNYFDKQLKNVESASTYDLPSPYDLANVADSDTITDDIKDRLKEISSKLSMSSSTLNSVIKASKVQKINSIELSDKLIDSSKRYHGLQKEILSSKVKNPKIKESDLNALTNLFNGKFNAAEKALAESENSLLEIAESSPKKEDLMLDVAKKRAQRAETVLMQFNHRRAGHHYSQAHNYTPEKNKEEKISYLLKAGSNYTDARLFEDAKYLNENALAEAEKNFGKSHPIVAEALNNLGTVYAKLGRYDEAITGFQRSLTILEKFHGQNSVTVGKTLNSIASTQVSQKRYDQALQPYERSLGIFSKNFGSTHDLVITTLSNLVDVYRFLGRHQETENLLKSYLNKLDTRSESHKIKRAIIMSNLGTLYINQANPEQSLKYFKPALMIFENKYGKNHPEIARILNSIATLEFKRGNSAIALDSVRRALRIVKASFKPNHPNIELVQRNFNDIANKVLAEGRTVESQGEINHNSTNQANEANITNQDSKPST